MRLYYPLHTMKHVPEDRFGLCTRPECGLPALPHCGLVLPTLIGPLQAFFCLSDFLAVLRLFQAVDDQENSQRQANDALKPLRHQVVELAPRILGGSWPSQEDLRKAYSEAEQHFDQARETYLLADDMTQEGHHIRMQMLQRAALCLFFALCLEEYPLREGLHDQVVNWALAHVSSPLLTKDPMIIREKEIPRGQIVLALVALCFSRASNSANEEIEAKIISQALQGISYEVPQMNGEEPELSRALALLNERVRAEAQQKASQKPFWPLSPEENAQRRKGYKEGQRLSDGLARLKEGRSLTSKQAPLVWDYIAAFQQQNALLLHQVKEKTIEVEVCQQTYDRLAGEWNQMLATKRDDM